MNPNNLGASSSAVPYTRAGEKKKTTGAITRTAFTDQERLDLCIWVLEQEKELGHRPKWQHIQNWFAESHGSKIIAQSTISKILKTSLSLVGTKLSNPTIKKKRDSDWPILDEALFAWHQGVQKKVPISGLVLREKAAVLYAGLNLVSGNKPPEFSDGWLSRWKQRHGVKQYTSHGESGSTPLTNNIEEEMETIREILAEYSIKDIFNVDETGYYYAMQPDRTLSTEQLEGTKVDKSRITAVLTTNGFGDERLPLWIIGTAKDPRCFKNINRNPSHLDCYYRYNPTAWMKGDIIIEYLEWFDKRMHNRKVILLMDNFFAHQCDVRDVGGNLGLKNTRIIWLPANTTSKYQPLDQGIIRTWKAYTRRHYIRYLIHQIDTIPEGQKIEKPNVLQAIRWAVEAWKYDIKESTIFNCFMKSSVKLMEPTTGTWEWPEPIVSQAEREIIQVRWEAREEFNQIAEDINKQLTQVQLRNNTFIKNTVNIEEFLDPQSEQVEDSPDRLIEHILKTYQLIEAISNENEEENEPIESIVSIVDAIKALDLLFTFTSQQESDIETTGLELEGGKLQVQQDLEDLTRMKRAMEVLKVRKMSMQAQTHITTYFN